MEVSISLIRLRVEELDEDDVLVSASERLLRFLVLLSIFLSVLSLSSASLFDFLAVWYDVVLIIIV